MNLTKALIDSLRASHSPQADAGMDYQYSLIISHYPKTNKMSTASGRPAFIIHDWAGYLCSTEDKELLSVLVRLESASRGALRELITGEVQEPELPSPTLTLEDLEIEL